MNGQRKATEATVTPRRLSPLRILWKSRIWVALLLLAIGYLLTFHTQTAPLYPKVLLFAGAAIVGFWLLPDTMSMWRAARAGDVRQATVTSMDTSNWVSNGVYLRRMVWTDVTGATGESRLGHSHSFPTPKTKILVYADPRSGRTWWEEEL